MRVKAAAVNPKDAALRSGFSKFMTGNKFPKRWVPILPVSLKKRLLKPRVVKSTMKFSVIWRILAAAAAVPYLYLTALQALLDKAWIKAGDEALIYGAAGGGGGGLECAAVQLGKHFGARCHHHRQQQHQKQAVLSCPGR